MVEINQYQLLTIVMQRGSKGTCINGEQARLVI